MLLWLMNMGFAGSGIPILPAIVEVIGVGTVTFEHADSAKVGVEVSGPGTVDLEHAGSGKGGHISS